MTRHIGSRAVSEAHSFTSVTADPTSQPPRLYNVMRTGGGITWNPDAAREFTRRGFSVAEVNLSPQEATYLTQLARGTATLTAGQRAYLVTCVGRPVTVDGQIYCGPPPGLKVEEVISTQSAIDQRVRTGALSRALAWVDPNAIDSVRIYSGTGSDGESWSAAREFLGLYRELKGYYVPVSAFVEAMGEKPGWALPLGLRNLLARDQEMLASMAQPISLLEKSGRFSGRVDRYGGLHFAVGVVLLVVAGAAGAVALAAWKLPAIRALWNANQQAKLEFCKMALQVTNDPNATSEAKENASRLLESCGDVLKDSGPGPEWEQLMLGAVVIVGIVVVGNILTQPRE